jgi:hypothetical protein
MQAKKKITVNVRDLKASKGAKGRRAARLRRLPPTKFGTKSGQGTKKL